MAQHLAAAIQRRASKRGPLDKATRDGLVESIYSLLEEVASGKTPESGRPGSALPLNINFRVEHPNGKSSYINMLDEVASLVFKDKARAKAIVMESLVQTARRQSIRRSQKAMQTAYTGMTDAMFDWAERVSGLTGKPVGFAVTPESEAFRGVASQLEEGSMPTIFGDTPTGIKNEADGILENADRLEEMRKFLSRDKDEGGLGREVTAGEARRALKRLKRRVSTYVDVTSGNYDYLRSLLHIGDDLWNADRVANEFSAGTRQVARKRRQVDIMAVPLLGFDELGAARTGSVYMQKNLANALDTYGKAAAAARDADIFMQTQVFLKANLTSRQLTTLKNNMVSNVIMQAVRRGDPFVLARMVNDVIRYKMFERGGKGLSEADIKMYQALSDSGKINTSFVDAEIAALNKGGVLDRLTKPDAGKLRIGSGTKKFLDRLNLPQKAIEDVYRFSDEMFKIEEGVRSYKQINRWLKRMNENDHIDLRVSPVRNVRLVKRGDDLFELDGKALSPDKLRSIIGKASMQVGEDLFFNFFDVADWARKIRISKGVALASPFYTWFSKALDIPFVKRGLLSEIYRGSPAVSTNNAAILAEVAANQSRIGATMDIAAAYGRHEPYDSEAMKTLRKTLGWGRGPQAGVIDLYSKADLIAGYVSLNQANPWGPTDLIFRAMEGGTDAIASAFGGTPGLEDIAELYRRAPTEQEVADFKKTLDPALKPQQKRARVQAFIKDGYLNVGLEGLSEEQRRETLNRRMRVWRLVSGEAGLTLSDGLDLIGMAGSPLLEVWHLASEAEKRDKDVNWTNAGFRFLGMLVGGTYAKAYDSMVGGVAPHHPLTSRYAFQDPVAGEEETFLRGAIRKVTGLGWQPKNVEKRGDKYFKRLEQKWDETLLGPITKDIADFEKRANDTSIGPDARDAARASLDNAENLKQKIRDIIKAEVESMKEEHLRLLDDIGERKKAKEEDLPPGTRAGWIKEGRTGTFNIMKGAR